MRPLLEGLGEEGVGDTEDDGRRRLAAGQLRQLLEVGVVDGEEGPVVAAVPQRPHQAGGTRGTVEVTEGSGVTHPPYRTPRHISDCKVSAVQG